MKPQDIKGVAENHLCCGCGVCAYLEPETVTMVNILSEGNRPLVAEGTSTKRSTLDACPGAGLAHNYDATDPEIDPDLTDGWGPVRSVWEGYAADPDIRWAGSSAGAATVLALHCLENEGMAGVLHTGANSRVPYLNESVYSTDRASLLAATGSRYAPASPCDRLDMVEGADRPSVFIGKPCDVAGAQAAAEQRPGLKRNLGLTIAVFCAGTPSTAGTLEMLAQMGIDDPRQLSELRYRGNGWPGEATAKTVDDESRSLTYEQSWGDILQRHRQWRCYVCVDHTGEFADIAVGDPWYRQPEDGEAGRSLIVARTQRGQQILDRALTSGALIASQVGNDLLPRSQPNLEQTRGAIWGRMLVTRTLGVGTPSYKRLPTFSLWLKSLSTGDKVRSIGGTVRRVKRKRLRHSAPTEPRVATEHPERRS